MTTVAYADGVMAADTQATWGGNKSRVHKLFRLPNGGVMGGCGTADEINRAFSWLAKGAKGKPPKIPNSSLLIAKADGTVYSVTDKHWTWVEELGPVAIGSGAQAALCAMRHFMATPKEAVHAAASVDTYTSAPVETMAVEPKRAPKRKARPTR
jgi:ATP-dependent protease HslVU (ClpYQ) peptidase subunit